MKNTLTVARFRRAASLCSALAALLLAPLLALHAADAGTSSNQLIVYGPVPGLAGSDHYVVRVRPAGVDAPWQKPFVFKTACKDVGGNSAGVVVEGYWCLLSGWSHSYVNFETSGPVEVEVAKADGAAIRKATVHPERFGRHVQLKDGKAYFTLEKPCLVAVDIDGAMRDQDTGMTPSGKPYSGPPIHALSIFANPVFANKPRPDDPGVYALKPGEVPPTNGHWKTLAFLPGVHDIGLAYPLQTNRNYYIPGDALVYGTFHGTGIRGGGHDIHIFGCGTLSGDRLTHPAFLKPPVKGGKEGHYRDQQYCPIIINGPYNTTVEGLTIANPAMHSCILWTASDCDPARPTSVRWVKVLAWRVNTDGFGTARNAMVEDCFLRCQDDDIYPCGLGIRRLVSWHDANGSVFLLTSLSRQNGQPLVVEDCDVIFARKRGAGGEGGRIFNMRGEGRGEGGRDVVFRNIRVEDPRPTVQTFLLQMVTEKPYAWPKPMGREPGDLAGILFQNIQIAAPSVLGERDIFRGGPECKIRDLTFDNVIIGGKKLTSPKDFVTNEHVEDLHFK